MHTARSALQCVRAGPCAMTDPSCLLSLSILILAVGTILFVTTRRKKVRGCSDPGVTGGGY